MARTAAQNKRIRDAKRELILTTALNQFSLKGYYSTRIQDIAEAADISQGLMYYYYPSKEAIYIDLVTDSVEKINETARYVREMSKTFGEKIMYALRILFKTIETSYRFRQTCRMIAQATYQADISDEAQVQLDKKRDISYRIMAEIFRKGQIEGSVVDGDPMELSILFWTSVNGLAIYYATRDIASKLPDYRLVAPMFLKNYIEIVDVDD
ncbi:MAG: TetR/AcrR family transcriptional regulator [Clostridiales bacterium]|nr:TetR/AcrR family transcriptional regulator [Clostridiales bacterium]